MEPFTPRAVFDLYVLLSNVEKLAFLKMVGHASTAEAPFVITHELPLPEKKRYADMMFETLVWEMFPLLQREARQLAREMPQLSDEEFDKLFHERIKQSMERYNRDIGELEKAKLKEQRDRKSDPEIVRRNMEICDLRKQDKKKWTLGRLAKQYEMTRQSIVSILKEEDKWRRLASQM